jgi:preprotein translocase subunit SecE
MINFKEKAVNFLKEVKQEMKKVTWLNKKELINYTLLVIGVSFVVAVILGGLDNIFRFVLFSLVF